MVNDASPYFYSISDNKAKMPFKILVVYATCTGTTAGVAETIGDVLKKENRFEVDVKPVKEVDDVSQYKAIIAGSAIQAGKWLPEALDFTDKFHSQITQKKFAAFLVCMTLAMPNGDKYREHVSTWINPVKNTSRPISIGLFSGALDIKKVQKLSNRICKYPLFPTELN